MNASATSIPLTPQNHPGARDWAPEGDPSLFKRARTWWLLLALLLLAQGNGIFTIASGAGEKLKTLRQFYSPSTPTLLFLTILLWTICAGLLVTRLGPILRLMMKQKAILAFAILAFLSTFWSQDPGYTFRKATVMFLIFCFAWLFAACYSASDQMRLLLAAGVIVAVGSIAMAVLLPKYGLDSGGEWKGVFAQKNELGQAMTLLFSGLAFRPISNRRRLLIVGLLSILPISLIVLSQSKEYLVLSALLVGVAWYGPFIASRRRGQLPFVIFATALGILALVFGRDLIFYLLGRDSTLTGRTQEWAILFPYTFKHFWLGYGFQAFWTGTGDSFYAMSRVGGAMRGADSGYLDTMLQFGVAGMFLWLILLLVCFVDFAKLFRGPSTSLSAYWYAGLILTTFVGSFAGTIFVTPGGLGPFVFVVACAGLTTLKDQERFHIRPPSA